MGITGGAVCDLFDDPFGLPLPAPDDDEGLDSSAGCWCCCFIGRVTNGLIFASSGSTGVIPKGLFCCASNLTRFTGVTADSPAVAVVSTVNGRYSGKEASHRKEEGNENAGLLHL